MRSRVEENGEMDGLWRERFVCRLWCAYRVLDVHHASYPPCSVA